MTRLAVEAKEQGAILGLRQNEQDQYRRIPSHIYFVPHPIFSLSSTQKKLFGVGAEVIEAPNWVLSHEIKDENDKPKTQKRKFLSPQEEVTIFLRYNYARYRLSKLIEAQKEECFSLLRARELLLWHKRVLNLRSDITTANMGLVTAMIKKIKITNTDFEELFSEGSLALLRAVNKFDVSRGYKFSTYACRAIHRSLGRLASCRGRDQLIFFGNSLDREEPSINDFPTKTISCDANEALDVLWPILTGNAVLTAIEAEIVIERFALISREGKKTLIQVGKIVGLTRERVRQIQKRALKKIRIAIEADQITKNAK